MLSSRARCARGWRTRAGTVTDVDGPYLAIDIGGTKLAAGIVDGGGELVVRDRIATPSRDVWPALARLVKRVVAASPAAPVACGVGCGGPMAQGGETVSPLHIPSWRGFELKEAVIDLTGLPTTIDNDAKAMALAEAWCGAGAALSDFVGLVVGRGVGGGIISGGRLLQGRLGNAGHIGHVVVEPNGRPCSCGGRGCLEAYASGVAIEEETGRAVQRAPAAIIERTGALVGRALASVGAVVDLHDAIIGGSVALGFGEPFFDAARRELDARARLSFTTGFTVVPAGLGQRAPLVGAAALAKFARTGATRG
jgi:glucokinase